MSQAVLGLVSQAVLGLVSQAVHGLVNLVKSQLWSSRTSVNWSSRTSKVMTVHGLKKIMAVLGLRSKANEMSQAASQPNESSHTQGLVRNGANDVR